MSTALINPDAADALAMIDNPSPEALQAALAEGRLEKLSTEQRLQYLAAACRSTGLNPLTRPFEFITLNGKITMYARKDATDQLRKLHNVSVRIISREQVGDTLIVTARASLPNGREDESIGAVPFGNLRGEAAAMAAMKAETKAKRRVTLSICGLGFMDESEVEDAQRMSHAPQGAAPAMPQSADVQPKDDSPTSPQTPQAEESAAVVDVETEPVPVDDSLVDLLAVIADADADKLTECVAEVKFIEGDAKQEMARKAIKARAAALGVKWDKQKGEFV